MHGGVMKDKRYLLIFILPTLATMSSFSASPLFVFSAGRTPEYRDYGPTNLYRFVASNFTNELFDFAVNLDANYCTPGWSAWKDTELLLVELWKTALVPDGFIMCCRSKGADENGANCMVYRVSTSHRKIEVTRLDQFIEVSKFDTAAARAVHTMGLRGLSVDDHQIKGVLLIRYENKQTARFLVKIGEDMGLISARRIGS